MFTCVSRESILLPLIRISWPSIGGTAETCQGTPQACFVPCSLCMTVIESRQALENKPGALAGVAEQQAEPVLGLPDPGPVAELFEQLERWLAG